MAFDIEAYNKTLIRAPEKIEELKKEWVDIYDSMRVHTRGDDPRKLLSERRPNEADEIYDYRIQIYVPITKGPINRSMYFS